MILAKNVKKKILEIAIELTQPTEYALMLQNIIHDSMDITNSDAGTLYIMDKGKLYFMIMITKSKGICIGGDGNPVNLPPVELDSNSVCAYVARERLTMNVPDVYNDSRFDWQGPKKYDALNGYHTTSELVVPLINHEQKVIGVIQLINACDRENNVVAYTEEEESILEAIGSLAAVSLSNYNMINQLQDLLDSFVISFTTAIDARTPYNANHTRHVAQYCESFCDFLVEKYEGTDSKYNLSSNQRDQVIMAASLHDVGKLIVPLEIMNKPDRLAERLKEIEMRFKWLTTDMKVKLHTGMMTQEQFDADLAKYNEYMEFIRKANTAGFLSDDDFEMIDTIDKTMYLTSDNIEVDFITAEEVHELKIRKGTLTAEERNVIEMHAAYTGQILEKIAFGEKYDRVRFYAASHHEYLNGTGYPNKLVEKDIPIEVRIITIFDVFDSLVSSDRPYKKAMDKERAISVLYAMADEGKLDVDIVELAEEFMQDRKIL